MKSLYSFLFCLFFKLWLVSQTNIVFCPPGAEWNYNFKMTAGGAPPPHSYTYLEKIKYTRDTLMNGNFYKVIQHKEFFSRCGDGYPGLTVLRQNGDTIFLEMSLPIIPGKYSIILKQCLGKYGTLM